MICNTIEKKIKSLFYRYELTTINHNYLIELVELYDLHSQLAHKFDNVK